MAFNITPVVVAFFGLISTILTVIVVPLIKAKTTAQQQAMVQSIVNAGVAAAEQLFIGSGRGAEKKEYVINYVSDYLKILGLTIDKEVLNALIESSVYALKNGVL